VPDIRFDEASDLDLLLFRQEGVLSLAQAKLHLSVDAVRHRVRSGRWQQLHRGIFLTHNGPTTRTHREWAAVLGVGSAAVLGGSTALSLAGRRTESSAIHVLVATKYQPRSVPGGVIVHRTTTLPDSHVHWLAKPPRTKPGRSVVDAAQWARTDDAARLAVADAFQRTLVTFGDVIDVLAVMPRARRRELVRQTAHDCAGGSRSISELDYLRLNRRWGLPDPTRQAIRYDANGHRRYLDALYEPWGVHVEVDGGQHTEAKAWWADMQRQNALWIAGDRVLRFPAWAIRERPSEVFAQVRAALVAAGWPDLGAFRCRRRRRRRAPQPPRRPCGPSPVPVHRNGTKIA
jgi:hypothetical protein